MLATQKDLDTFCQLRRALLIATPEKLCRQKNWEEKLSRRAGLCIVFDEFHLFYHWGDSFRPSMAVVYEGIFSMQIPSLLLTATLGEVYLSRWKKDALRNYEHVFHADFGNQILKNSPFCYEWFPICLKGMLDFKLRLIFLSLANQARCSRRKTFLIFCQYRTEVQHWAGWLESLGLNVLFCLGGQATEFTSKLKGMPHPDVIVATTVLSHGVNLPAIESVILTYAVEEKDFWIQMVGRGGRKGERFSVLAVEEKSLWEWCRRYQSWLCLLQLSAWFCLLQIPFFTLFLGKLPPLQRGSRGVRIHSS